MFHVLNILPFYCRNQVLRGTDIYQQTVTELHEDQLVELMLLQQIRMEIQVIDQGLRFQENVME